MSLAIEDALERMPLVAILRGVAPEEAIAVGEALADAGVRCLEVPLNSPRPLESIRLLSSALEGRAVVGAGTVLSADGVDAVANAGGRLIVSPNVDPVVIARTKALGLFSMPGFFTATEAFSAIDAGADVLKLFPAELAGPGGVRAIKAVLPKTQAVYAVGGVDADNIDMWARAGADGYGVGSALFTPGLHATEVGARARRFIRSVGAVRDMSAL